jgi:hypothetical protein
MFIPFTSAEEQKSFPLIPDGEYLCVTSFDKHGNTKDGQEIWFIKFIVAHSEKYAGTIIYDTISGGNQIAINRAKIIFKALGLDTSNDREVKVSEIEGKEVYVTVETKEYEDKKTGNTRKKNAVTFAGFRPFKTVPPETTEVSPWD